MSIEGVIRIHGKEYKTVAFRVADFRKNYKDHSIITELISNSDRVIIKATVIDGSRNIRATGYAEEKRGSSNINTTSVVENCETSAIGRALACFGLSGSGEYASANEVIQAIEQQKNIKNSDLQGGLNQTFGKMAPINESQLTELEMYIAKTKSDKVRLMKHFKVKKLESLSEKSFAEAMEMMKRKKK